MTVRVVLLGVSAIALAVLHHAGGRPDLAGGPDPSAFWTPAVCWTVLVLAWMALVRLAPSDRLPTDLLVGAVVLRLIVVPVLPVMSDDVYRFVWDGRLSVAGWDPFALTPRQVLEVARPELVASLGPLFPHLNSPDYATVYPPVLQATFALAAWLGGASLLWTVVALKLAIVAADLVSLGLLASLARPTGTSMAAVWVYALCPLVISELTGSVHFEAYMVASTLATVWLIDRGRPSLAALALSIGVGSKLLPLIFVPAMLRRLDPAGAVRFLVVLAAAGFAMAAPLVLAGDAATFWSSLRLYYATFVFNAGVTGWVRGVVPGEWTAWVGALAAGVAALLILALAARRPLPGPRDLLTTLLLSLATYQLLAVVVHPWYLAPLIGLGALTGHRFAAVWGALAWFTYGAYYGDGPTDIEALVAAEHVIVWLWLGVELFRFHGRAAPISPASPARSS